MSIVQCAIIALSESHLAARREGAVAETRVVLEDAARLAGTMKSSLSAIVAAIKAERTLTCWWWRDNNSPGALLHKAAESSFWRVALHREKGWTFFLFTPVMHFKCFVPPPPLEKGWKLIVKRCGIGNEFSRSMYMIVVFFWCVCVWAGCWKINQKLNCHSDRKRSGDYFGGLGFVLGVNGSWCYLMLSQSDSLIWRNSLHRTRQFYEFNSELMEITNGFVWLFWPFVNKRIYLRCLANFCHFFMDL